MKTAVTPERKVEKSIPRWELNGHSEGYKWVIDQNWGRMAKIGILDQKPRFWAQKKGPLLNGNHVLATIGKSCSKKKVPFSQINNGLLANFGCFLGKNAFLSKKYFSVERKNCHFSVLSARTKSVVIVGHFFVVPDSPQN